MTDTPLIKVLLVEDSRTDARLLRQSLGEIPGQNFDIVWVERIKDAIAKLRDQPFDVGLLDLSLPDSSGIETFTLIQQAVPALPIVVLTGAADESAGVEAISRGVQDYLAKGAVSARTMARIIRYAIERKKAEMALAAERDRVLRYLDVVEDILVALDTEARITLVNRRVCKVLGYEEHELIGKDWFRVCLPPGEYEQVFGVYKQIIAGDIQHFEYYENHILTKSNKERLVTWHNTLLRDDQGRVTGTLSAGTDVTEQRLSEDARRQLNTELEKRVLEAQTANSALRESRRAALNLMEDAVDARKKTEQAVADLNRLMQTFRAHSEISLATARVDDEETYLRQICDIIVSDCGYPMIWIGYAEDDAEKSIRPAAYAGFEQGYLESLKATWADVERGRGPTGTAIRTGKIGQCRDMITDPAFAPWRAEAIKRGYASSIAFPLKTVAGTFGALTMYAKEPDHFNEQEINELAELADDLAFGISAIRLRAAHAASAEELKQRAQELADTNTELEAFTYSASHDLRAPLRTMISFSTFLQEDYGAQLDDQGKDFLDRIAKGAQKMNQLIDDLLALSRITRQEMSRTDVDLSAIAASIVADLQVAEPERDVTVAIQPSLMALCDQRLMYLVLTNMLQNAWKYSRDARPAVIQFGEMERDGEMVYYVKDNGAGFDMGFAERLFKPFQRLHSEAEFEGTGIGLAIVERVIRRHGGKVWAEGVPAKGATFCFTLAKTR